MADTKSGKAEEANAHETRRDGVPASADLRLEIDAEARQQLGTRKLRALLQTDKDRDPEIRRLLKTLSAYDAAMQLGLL